MPTEIPNKKTKRRRYRTRMFDNRLSFPTSSEQVWQLQAESEAEERSVASLIREAIDQFLPRLRKRRQKHQRTPLEPLAAGSRTGNSGEIVRRLLGDPEKRTEKAWHYGPLRMDLETWLWKDSETGQGGSIVDLVMREKQLGWTGAQEWIRKAREAFMMSDRRP